MRFTSAILLLVPCLVGCGSGSSSGSSSTTTTAAVNTNATGGSNRAPVVSSSAPGTATEGVAYLYMPLASDPDGDPLAFRLGQGPAGLSVDPLSGAVRWTPSVGQAGAHDVALELDDGQIVVTHAWTIQVAAAATALPQSLVDLGAPTGGLPVISDLVSFGDKIWMLESLDPLGQFGAKVFTFDPISGDFTQVLSDPTSQGYLRGKVIGGKLFVPDSDPNGLAPGIVHVWDSPTASPRATVVDQAVHSFDVVELQGQIYVSGGLDNQASALSRYDAASGRWIVTSQGNFSRLKYLAALDGSILGTKRNIGSAADLVQINGATQQGLDLFPGEAIVLCLEPIQGRVYVSAAGASVAHVRIEPGGAITPLTGLGGVVAFDYVRHDDGRVYAIVSDLSTRSAIYVSDDGLDFRELISVNDLRFGRVGNNADGRPSLVSFQGQLYAGSSTNGRLYRLD
ncbi:MAG: hypothetical protein JKY65_10935 [Planctomycetes bacterium]|nr:hypothetical protein [Planctomycetota bacterium]